MTKFMKHMDEQYGLSPERDEDDVAILAAKTIFWLLVGGLIVLAVRHPVLDALSGAMGAVNTWSW
jgi:hypothetical protein